MAGAGDGAGSTFVDDTWRMKPPKFIQNIKSMRLDGWSRVHCNMLGKLTGLQSLYLLDAKKEIRQQPNGTANGIRSQGASPATPSTPASASGSAATMSLGRDYVEVLSTSHGQTLRQLLLAAHWRLGSDDIAKLVRSCPNLEQLGLGMEKSDFDLFRLLVAFPPNLFALRVLENSESSAFSQELKASGDGVHEKNMPKNLCKHEHRALRWVGICDMVFRVGKLLPLGDAKIGKTSFTGVVERVSSDIVQDIEIWGLDSLEI